MRGVASEGYATGIGQRGGQESIRYYDKVLAIDPRMLPPRDEAWQFRQLLEGLCCRREPSSLSVGGGEQVRVMPVKMCLMM